MLTSFTCAAYAGVQGEVFVATSFAIQANGSKLEGREEGLALPRATPGSGDVRLVAGVGNLPAIQVGPVVCMQRGMGQWGWGGSLDGVLQQPQGRWHNVPCHRRLGGAGV